MSYRTAFFLALPALALSTALHFVPQRSAPPPSTNERPADASTCAAELIACRSESWNLVAKTIVSDVEDQPRPSTTTSAATVRDEKPIEPTGSEDQRRVLCEVAESEAREHWTNHRADILASVKDVGTPAWIASEKKKYLDKLTTTLGADRAETAKLDRGYDAMWQKYGPILASELAADPVDAATLIDSVRGVFHEEDAVVDASMGARARDDYRASELRNRTAIVAILAALADKPFDDALTW